jgi:putative sterol carrier protein
VSQEACKKAMNPKTAFKFFAFMANRNTEAKKIIESGKHIFQIDLEGEDKFYLETKDGKLFLRDGENENPSVTISTTKKIMSDLIKGNLKSDSAFLEGKFEIKGSIFDGAKFNRLVNIMLEGSTSRFLGILRRLM